MIKRKFVLLLVSIFILSTLGATVYAKTSTDLRNKKIRPTNPTTTTSATTAAPTTTTPTTVAPTTTMTTTTAAPTTTMTEATSPMATTSAATAAPIVQTTTSQTTRSTTIATTTAGTSTAANMYYVSPLGNDAGSGSEAAPLKTIQKAINIAPRGSIIIVAAGTYNEKLSISGKTGIEIRNRAGDRPVLSGAGFSSGYLIDIRQSANIIFSGFEVCDFKGYDLEGVKIHYASSNIEISNCLFHDIGTTSDDGNAHVILASGNSNTVMSNIVIKNNEIYRCTTGWSESVTVQSNVDGFSITGNKIHDVTNIAIDVAGFYDNGVTISSLNQARNGRIADNLVYNVNCSYATCAGIYVDGGRDVIIEYNTIYNSMYGIEVGCENPVDRSNTSVRAIVSGIVVRYNVIYNNTKTGITIGGYNGTKTGQVINSQITNNTLYKNQTEVELSYCDNITLNRNIFYSSGASSSYFYENDPINKVTNLHANDNIFFAESSSGQFTLNDIYVNSLAKWQSTFSQDLTSRFADPLFVNKAAYNFNLLANSPVIGYGAK